MYQNKGETVKEFSDRFFGIKNTIPNMDKAKVIHSFHNVITCTELYDKISSKQPETIEQLMRIIDNYILVEAGRKAKTRKS